MSISAWPRPSATSTRLPNSQASGVTVYSPATRDDRSALRTLPVRVWLEVHPTFWIASDEHHLLISLTQGSFSEPAPATRPTLQLVPTPA